MGSLYLPLAIAVLCLLFLRVPISAASVQSLAECLTSKGIANFTTPSSPSFDPILNISIQNLRFTEPGVPKPEAIILPSSVQEVQKAWACVRKSGFALRVRSGGHSYEGLSSTADVRFVIIDFMNLKAISIDVARRLAWVEAGVLLGELYYAVSTASSRLAFSAGIWPSVGVSGHVMGGGYGMLSRKYGVAADNALDAQVITDNGTLITTVATVDPELFWAIRGGGGGAWGIVVAWKLKLVPVPAIITTFSVNRTGKEAITDLAYTWQSVVPNMPPELIITIFMLPVINFSGAADLAATIFGQYWGSVNQTTTIVNSLYPELGLTESDCTSGTWIEAVESVAGVSDPSELLNWQPAKTYFKGKSDYVSKPLTKAALSGAYDILIENTGASLIFEAYGGVMSQISPSAIAFPHRAGNLYIIQYNVRWTNETDAPDDALINWLRGLYSYMAPFVAYTPSRSANVNYIDLDLGDSVTAGKSYFASNFPKLVKIKARIDPCNVFNQPQSVPTSMERASAIDYKITCNQGVPTSTL